MFGKRRGGAVHFLTDIYSLSIQQSRSSKSPLFMESYANMHVYEENKLLIQENLIKICVGDFLKKFKKLFVLILFKSHKDKSCFVIPEHQCLRHLTGPQQRTWALN